MLIVTQWVGYEHQRPVGYLTGPNAAALAKQLVDSNHGYEVTDTERITAVSVTYRVQLTLAPYTSRRGRLSTQVSNVEFVKQRPVPATVIEESTQKAVLRIVGTRKAIDSRSTGITSVFDVFQHRRRPGDYVEITIQGSDPKETVALARERLRALKVDMKKDQYTEPTDWIDFDPDAEPPESRQARHVPLDSLSRVGHHVPLDSRSRSVSG